MRQPFHILVTLFALAVCVCATVIWRISSDARPQIVGLATAHTDSVQWSRAQSEVEVLSMQVAAHQAFQAPGADRVAALGVLRQRFDIFYSRIGTLTRSGMLAPMRDGATVSAALDETQAFLDRWVTVIDDNDLALTKALPDFLAATATLRPQMRRASLEGVRLFSGKTESQRVALANALTDLAMIVRRLFGALMLAVIALAILFRNARRQELHSQAMRNRLQIVIGTSIDGILVADARGLILDFNEAAAQIYGYCAQDVIGTDLAHMIAPQDKRQALRLLLRRLRTKPDLPLRVGLTQSIARRRSGELFPIELSLSSAESSEGPVVVAFVRDISGRARAQAELVEARDRAVTGERAKPRMLAVMGHEIRTSLNGVLGTLDLLNMTQLDDTQRYYVEVIEQSGRMLLAHVSDVLDISRADEGRITLVNQSFDPRRLAFDVLEGL